MKIEVEKLLAIIELMHIDSLKKITITTDATGVYFDNEAMTVHVKSSEQMEPATQWGWINHNGGPPPMKEMLHGLNEIEVEANGETSKFNSSENFMNVRWSSVVKWRRTK